MNTQALRVLQSRLSVGAGTGREICVWHGKCLGRRVPSLAPLARSALVPAVLLLSGCDADRPVQFQSAPKDARFVVEIASADRLTSIETDTVAHNGDRAKVDCKTCHARVDVGTPAKAPAELKEFHQGLSVLHGNLACASCHEPGEPLALHLATGEKLELAETMTLCSQCHGTQRRSYDNGAHGGMNGHWDLSRGPRLRNQCVHCHDPHMPKIPQVMPVLAPIDRGKLPEPHGEGEHR